MGSGRGQGDSEDPVRRQDSKGTWGTVVGGVFYSDDESPDQSVPSSHFISWNRDAVPSSLKMDSEILWEARGSVGMTGRSFGSD